jgi:hypothetical protein
MTNDFDENMSAILETANNVVPTETPKDQVPVVHGNAKADFDYSRLNYYSLIEKGNEALEGIMQVAKESQHPRAYEVAGNMLKNLSDMTDKLMQLQHQMKQLEGPTKQETNVTVDKAVFVGSTADLLKKIKNAS